MQKRLYSSILVFLLFMAGQVFAQRFVALDVSRINGFKRIKYYVGDDISFKSGVTHNRYKGKITALSDSLIFFGNNNYVNVSEISIIYRDNGTFVNKGLGKFLMVFGIGFISLDTFNNLINNRRPLVNDLAVKEGAIASGSGVLLYSMLKKRYKMGKKRSVKIMDLDLDLNKNPGASNDSATGVLTK